MKSKIYTKEEFKQIKFDWEEIPAIYEIVIDGKNYIGQTKNLRQRLYLHNTSLFRQRNDNKLLQAAFDNTDEITINILETFDVNLPKLRKTLNRREIFYIHERKAIENGFNFFNGGAGNANHRKKRISFEKFNEAINLIKEGKIDIEIQEETGIDLRTLYKIRYKKRFKEYFSKVDYPNPIPPKYRTRKILYKTRILDLNLFEVLIQEFLKGTRRIELYKKYDVSLEILRKIRNGEGLKHFWEETTIISKEDFLKEIQKIQPKRRKMSDETFIRIVKMILEGRTNPEIEFETGVYIRDIIKIIKKENHIKKWEKYFPEIKEPISKKEREKYKKERMKLLKKLFKEGLTDEEIAKQTNTPIKFIKKTRLKL